MKSNLHAVALLLLTSVAFTGCRESESEVSCEGGANSVAFEKGKTDAVQRNQDEERAGEAAGRALTPAQGTTAGYQAGYQAGYNNFGRYQAGYNSSYPGGFQAGRVDPQAVLAGQFDGVQNGSRYGLEDGINQGYADGYADGWAVAYADVYTGRLLCPLREGRRARPAEEQKQICEKRAYRQFYNSASYGVGYQRGVDSNSAYLEAYQTAYPSGVEAGKSAAFIKGQTDGYAAGYTAGYNETYGTWYELSYSITYSGAYTNGYTSAAGYGWLPSLWSNGDIIFGTGRGGAYIGYIDGGNQACIDYFEIYPGGRKSFSEDQLGNKLDRKSISEDARAQLARLKSGSEKYAELKSNKDLYEKVSLAITEATAHYQRASKTPLLSRLEQAGALPQGAPGFILNSSARRELQIEYRELFIQPKE